MPTLDEIRKKHSTFKKYAEYAYANKDTILGDTEDFNSGKPYEEQLKNFSEFEVSNESINSLIDDTKAL